MSGNPGRDPLLIIAVTLALLAVVNIGAWLATGASFVTQYEVATTVTESDEFGDEIERTIMQEQFQFGLLPDRGHDGAGTNAGALLLIAGVLLFIRSRRKGSAESKE